MNYPLQRLTDLLDRWDREEKYSSEDIKRFGSELWMTLQEYEKDLRD